ncbi:E3 ubiquitin-protein ligase Itchy-like protein [Platysternon megacephalum]|uniref:E3 ubiquitin-protein ligase Itchy-like protein n=1 Tax=Platysternon megacephalum TaxID=55544 RepID=A0A4D9DMC5_9SAUR|nr:E3 ubiquitin-protein ligase Itchy-like protein [Platysternon megacephalum]
MALTTAAGSQLGLMLWIRVASFCDTSPISLPPLPRRAGTGVGTSLSTAPFPLPGGTGNSPASPAQSCHERLANPPRNFIQSSPEPALGANLWGFVGSNQDSAAGPVLFTPGG